VMNSRSRSSAFVAALVGLLAVVMLGATGGPWLNAGTTTTGPSTYVYDAPAFASVDAHTSAPANGVHIPLGVVREGAATPPSGVLGTSTTPR